MPYFVETWDKPNSFDLRQRVRPEHLEFLDTKKRLLLAAGAKLPDDGEGALGSLYIVDVETREEAEAFIAEDPFTRHGLPERIEITRWRKAFFNFENTLRNP